jgi:MFS transporter, FHS family, glucose/mannose:H+ symporter
VIWPYLILAFLCLFTFGLCDNLRGPIYPELLREFNVSNSFGAWFYAITSLFSFVGSLFCLQALKRIDRIQNVYVALVLLTAGLIAQGLSANFWQLLVASSCMGLGLGFLGVSNNLLATIGSSAAKRQKVLSGLHSMYALSSLVAPLVVTFVYSSGGRWRECFFVGAALCLAVLVGGFIFQPKENTNLEKKIRGTAIEDLSHHKNVKLPGVAILAVAVASYVMAEILVSSRLALYLRVVKNYDLHQSSVYLTGFFVGLLAGRLLFSFYQPKIKLFNQLLVSLLVTVLMLILGIKVHESFFIASGLSMGPFFPLAVNYISESFPRALNRAMAFTVSIQSLFVVIMHLSFGWVTDAFGIIQAMAAGPMVLVMSGAFLMGFENWKRSS